MGIMHNVHVMTKLNDESSLMLQGSSTSIKSKLLKRLFGTDVGVLILNPGPGINEIKITRVTEDNDE